MINFLWFGHTNKPCELDLQKTLRNRMKIDFGLWLKNENVVPASEQYDFS